MNEMIRPEMLDLVQRLMEKAKKHPDFNESEWIVLGQFIENPLLQVEYQGIEINTFYERQDDMGQGRLRVIRQEDGDMIVSTVMDPDHRGFPSLEFCTPGTGGGKSSNVRNALFMLIKALQKDQEENPLPADNPKLS